MLVDYFMEKAAIEEGIKKPALPDKLFPLLETYDFPGNVGELKKMVVEAVRGGESGDISLEPFREKIRGLNF